MGALQADVQDWLLRAVNTAKSIRDLPYSSKMICLQAAIAGMTAEEYFIDGLRTGFRLALAILDEEENGLLKPISDGGKQP